ncbi:MAG TPA: selenocysteine-specific translation elongation factor [Acidimicrobiia bacterium]|nr:selenocysteine-specific translation elongation factor [Acidimicrobiia bacterium]
MPLIGTAGHVDHGKSTLIQRITGRDPDRWAEEKRRGLTIDLGFAWTTLPDGTEVSFVDVPGHEKFLKNMLAGIEAIDVALFVVAADEGWMPQSEEHLAVLDLLEVGRGVIALTKVDLVEEDLAELAAAETAERLAGTSLEGSEIIPLSAMTGEGVSALLDALVAQIPDNRAPGSRPRLWVDRSFTLPGAGTIITGTLLDGGLSVEDVVEVYPRGDRARVRAIQSHERSHQRIGPGRRVALNLAGVDHHEVTRGQMIGLPGHWETTRRFAVSLDLARFVEGIDQRGAYQIHVGTSSHRVEIIGMRDGIAVLQLDAPLPLTVGDRFILRDTGRKMVVGGGRLLDPAPGRTRQSLAASPTIDPSAGPDEVAARLLELRRLDRAARLSAHSGGGTARHAVTIGDQVVEPGLIAALAEKATVLVEHEHQMHPLRPGLPLATLAERLEMDQRIVEAMVERGETLVRLGPDIARSGHVAQMSSEDEAAWKLAVARLREGLSVPEESGLGVGAEIIHLKVRSGELVRVAPRLLYLPEQIEELKQTMAGLPESFTVAEFRDAAGLSRKYAVPILEWSDKEGLTVRRGDRRRLR